MSTNARWYWIICIVGIVMYGLYKMEELYLNHMAQMQHVSRQVIEK
jgi:hypothetical protein